MEAKDMNEMEPRIIEAAKRVFVRKGYEAATMSDVAAAFLDNDMGRFEEYMDRRRDLIVEVITQLMVPDAR